MAETKKEAFRKYLESAGAIDVLTRALLALYEEPDRPKDSTEFIKASLGAPTTEEYSKIEAENEQLRQDLEAAMQQIAELKAAGAGIEGTEEPAAATA